MERFSPERLRVARERAGIPRELVALDVGRSYHTVESYELGRVTPPGSVLSQLAARLGCQVSDLFEAVG